MALGRIRHWKIRQDNAKYHGSNTNHPEVLVLHSTYGYPEGDLATLRGNTSRQVSCHFLIQPNGKIYQFLPLETVAYHAGFSVWRGHRDVNHRSIGIEISNPPGHNHYPNVQIHATDWLIKKIDQRLKKKIPIVGHKDIDTRGKVDPEQPFPLANYKRWRQHEKPKNSPKPPPKPPGEPTIPPFPSKGLRSGMKGYWTRWAQGVFNAAFRNIKLKRYYLRHTGHEWRPLVVDGDFGPKTLMATKVYQKYYGLVPDGIIGPKTREKMK